MRSLLVVFSILLASSAFAEKLSLRFPLRLRHGMSRLEVDSTMGKKQEKGTTRYPLSSEIVYKNFRPSHVGVTFKPDKAEFDSWSTIAQARFVAAKTDAERKALYSGPAHEYKTDKLMAVNLIQEEVGDCEQLRAVFPDSLEFITKAYAVTLKERYRDQDSKVSNCLHGFYRFTFTGQQGYSAVVEAGAHGGGFTTSADDAGGRFFIVIMYLKADEDPDAQLKKTKSNL